MKNKIIVVVIAHNEQKRIRQCIESILSQSVSVEKIIILVHNSTDDTIKIALEISKEHRSVQVIAGDGSEGIISARLAAFGFVSEEDGIILCIDGDCIAKRNWIKVMVQTLGSNKNILVGSLVKFTGAIICRFLNIIHWWHASARNQKAIQWLWGSSFAFRAKDKELVEYLLRTSIRLKYKLQLSTSMEDYIRAHYLIEAGNIEVTRKTWVTMKIKEKNSRELIKRTRANLGDKAKLDNHFNN